MELAANTTREEICRTLGNGLTYNGLNLFDFYCEVIVPRLEEELEKDPAIEDKQECYLGWIPEIDTFIIGFDCWIDEECSWAEEDVADNVISFRVVNGAIRYINNVHTPGRMFYSGAYKALRKNYPTILDIRLD